jgi:hypothetical protein
MCFNNWNNWSNWDNLVAYNPGYVDFTLNEPNSSNGGTISTTENTSVDLSTGVGIGTSESWDEYYNGYYGYYYYNYGSPPSVYNFQFTAINSPSPSDDRIYLNLANSSEFYLSGNEVLLQSNNYEVSAMPCSESEVERRPSAALQKPCCTKPRSASQAMEIWLSCCRWGLGSCRVGTRREALYAGEAAFRWRGSSGGCGISDHVARGQDAMSVSRLCDTVAGAFSSACRY